MIKNTLILLNLVYFLTFTSLFAESSYEIILLAPEEAQLSSSYVEESTFSEAGYVGGVLQLNDNDEEVPFVYEHQKGMILIKLPHKSTKGKVTSINKNGIAVGTYEKREKQKIFLYNVDEDKCVDLLEHFQWDRHPDFSSFFDIENLFISDKDQVMVTFSAGWNLHTSYILDLQKKTITSCPFIHGTMQANSQGQMIGVNSEGDYYSRENPWFFDPDTGYHELGSLDKFNRWKVTPSTLSPNGVVAGLGWDSHKEERGFYWSQELGMQELNLEGTEDLFIKAVNDQGHIIGNFHQYSEDTGWELIAFFFHPTEGIILLDNPNVDENSSPAAINNHDQVVGSIEGCRTDNAFIWDAEHGRRLLVTLIPQYTGWKTLQEAHAINDAGWIIGKGLYYGVEHNFLLIPRQ